MASSKTSGPQYHPVATVDNQDEESQPARLSPATFEAEVRDNDDDDGNDPAAARNLISSAVFRAEISACGLWQPGGRVDLMAGIVLLALAFAIDAALYPVFTQAVASSTPSNLTTMKTLDLACAAISGVVILPMAQMASIFDRARTLIILWIVFQMAVFLTMTGFPLAVLGVTFHTIAQAGYALWLPVLLCEIFPPRARGIVIAALAVPVVVTSEAISQYLMGTRLLSLPNPGLLGLGGLISGGVLAAAAAIWRIERKISGAVMSWKGRRGSITLRDLRESLRSAVGLNWLLLPASMVTAVYSDTIRSSSGLVMLLLTLPLILAGVLGVVILVFTYSGQRESGFPSKRFFSATAIISELYTSRLINVIILTAIDAAIAAAVQLYAGETTTPTADSTTAIRSQCVAALLVGVTMFLSGHTGRMLLLPAAASKALGAVILLLWRQDGFLVQVLQGVGSGVLQTAALVAAQVIAAEEHHDVNTFNLAPITAAVAAAAYAGGSLGTSLANALTAGWLPPILTALSAILVALSMRATNVRLEMR